MNFFRGLVEFIELVRRVCLEQKRMKREAALAEINRELDEIREGLIRIHNEMRELNNGL